MKSIKPGREISKLNAVASIFMIIFGVFWTANAMELGGPAFFPIFGFIFIGSGILKLIYHIKNATSANRMSIYDITDSKEGDPTYLDVAGSDQEEKEYCPYCGTVVDVKHHFCKKCGQALQ